LERRDTAAPQLATLDEGGRTRSGGGRHKSTERPSVRVSGSATGGRRRVTGHGMLWSTAFTLGAYVAALLVTVIWIWPPDRDDLLIGFMSAPFAALATGAGWLIVWLLQLGPARRWAGAVQGACAGAIVLVVALAVFTQLR